MASWLIGRVACSILGWQVVLQGANEEKRVKRLVLADLNARRRRSTAACLRRLYPFLYPGSRELHVWEWLLSLSILPSVALIPLALAFSHDFYWLHPLRKPQPCSLPHGHAPHCPLSARADTVHAFDVRHCSSFAVWRHVLCAVRHCSQCLPST